MQLTIFTTPKPFRGITAVHQGNAIGSWKQIPDMEIIVFGGDWRVTRHLGVKYVPNVPMGPGGLPYVANLFRLAEELASNDLLIYANADLILLPDLAGTMRRVAERFARFLLVGQRWDVKLDQPLDYGVVGWEEMLRDYVQEEGQLHSVSGKDWMGFQRPLGLDIPAFLVGRPRWDDWLVDAALKVMPVVDATRCVTAIHPDHGYPGGWLWDEYSEYNRSLCNVPPNMGRISEATWKMTETEVVERAIA